MGIGTRPRAGTVESGSRLRAAVRRTVEQIVAGGQWAFSVPQVADAAGVTTREARVQLAAMVHDGELVREGEPGGDPLRAVYAATAEFGDRAARGTERPLTVRDLSRHQTLLIATVAVAGLAVILAVVALYRVRQDVRTPAQSPPAVVSGPAVVTRQVAGLRARVRTLEQARPVDAAARRRVAVLARRAGRLERADATTASTLRGLADVKRQLAGLAQAFSATPSTVPVPTTPTPPAPAGSAPPGATTPPHAPRR